MLAATVAVGAGCTALCAAPMQLSVVCGFLELRLTILAWVTCDDEDVEQVGSLPRLALPLMFILILNGVPNANIPRPVGLDACFVEH